MKHVQIVSVKDLYKALEVVRELEKQEIQDYSILQREFGYKTDDVVEELFCCRYVTQDRETGRIHSMIFADEFEKLKEAAHAAVNENEVQSVLYEDLKTLKKAAMDSNKEFVQKASNKDLYNALLAVMELEKQEAQDYSIFRCEFGWAYEKTLEVLGELFCCRFIALDEEAERIHSTISEKEFETLRVLRYITYKYLEVERNGNMNPVPNVSAENLFKAVEVAIELEMEGKILSISRFQRKLGWGFNRSCAVFDVMLDRGYLVRDEEHRVHVAISAVDLTKLKEEAENEKKNAED